MYLALLELKAARGRFLLMGRVVLLVAALVGIVSGFTTAPGATTAGHRHCAALVATHDPIVAGTAGATITMAGP